MATARPVRQWETFRPINNLCLDCHRDVDPMRDRQEIAFDEQGNCRRRCGQCIEKLYRMPISNTTGHINTPVFR